MQSILSKIMEKCVKSQLTTFLDQNNIYTPTQFGFRKGHTTVHAQIAATEIMYNHIKKNEICILVSLDLRKAFDTVNKNILLEKLTWYNIDNSWFKSYLTNRPQFVDLNEKYSSMMEPILSVPQGSVLGPLLFTLMINDLPLFIKYCKAVLFADDTQLLLGGKIEDLEEIIKKIEYDLEEVMKWMDKNGMGLNVDKTNFMVIGKKCVLNTLNEVNIKIKNTSIKRLDAIKCLGLTIDTNLEWTKHIEIMLRKANFKLKSLYPLKNMLNTENRLIIINSYVLPILRYMIVLYLNTKDKNIKEIDKFVKKCGRFVFDYGKYDKVKLKISQELKWLFPKYLYEYECLKLVYIIITKNFPHYFNDYLNLNETNVRATRNTNYVNRNNANDQSFKTKGSFLWTNLPDNIKSSVTLQIFKNKLNKLLIDKQTNDFTDLISDLSVLLENVNI